IVAEQSADAALVSDAFTAQARRDARTEIRAYLDTVAPAIIPEVVQAFDAAPTREAGIAAARQVVAQRAPRAVAAFPEATPRYIIVPPPTSAITDMRPYLDGQQALPDGRFLYGALNIRREAGAPVIEYWSVNLSHEEPSLIARDTMQLAMRREALAAQGLA